MSVTCPSVLCSLTSLPQVTSQARLESVVLEPQPGVTAGFAVCSRLWVASCLSFALQQALVLVPVGSLLPYGSQPSRWGHPCGVEASLSSIGTKV